MANETASQQYRERFDEALPLLRHLKTTQDEAAGAWLEFVNPSDWQYASAATGVSAERPSATLQRLTDDGLVAANMKNAGMGSVSPPIVVGVRVLPPGLRELQVWPPRDVVPEIFLQVLAQLAAQASPDEAPRLRRLQSAALEVSRDVLVQVLAGLANYGVGRCLGV